MEQFATTYRKDFLWPYVRSFGQKLIEPELPNTGFESRHTCKCFPPPDVPPDHQHDYSSGAHLEQQDWSRLGPMGPLLDPKLYPVRVGRPPETDTARQDQPNVFLKKLQDKYPFIYEVIQSAPGTVLANKVDSERYKSTYQIDFCHMNEYYVDDMVRAEGVEGMKPQKDYNRDPCLQYRQQRKPVASIAGAGGATKTGGDPRGVGEIPTVWTVPKTEYQDNISKIGDMIIRDKLHFHTKKR